MPGGAFVPCPGSGHVTDTSRTGKRASCDRRDCRRTQARNFQLLAEKISIFERRGLAHGQGKRTSFIAQGRLGRRFENVWGGSVCGKYY